ncbi:MAG: DNA repair protein RadA [Gammaproteobacteria bacterium]|nr:MAG: DNA repair protein RadA [Gammaproteobacteria bacterium]
MAKEKKLYACASCGARVSKWSGQCPDCDGWNTLEEVVAMAAATGRNVRWTGTDSSGPQLCIMSEVNLKNSIRIPTEMTELDRVLGGGLVVGSVTLLGGDPGIGKSTILLQAIAALSQELKTLYVTGEESLQQVTLRARRLGLQDIDTKLLCETQVERILEVARVERPQVMVIDSIQTVFTDLLQSAPGSVAQVRESAAQLVRYAKQTGTALILAGHVTKDGTLAGPRVLEHMVDTVLYFEGDTTSSYRVIRAVKNRFGAVNELGVFAMTEHGLKEVTNPSAIFLSRHEEAVTGSVIMVTREGSRPLLIEVQALVDESHLGNPRRVTLGLEQSRLSMLLAVLHRHGGVAMSDQDVFVNVVGGVRVNETGADLAVVLSVLSSYRDTPLAKDLIVFGEIGLAGEIRPVQGGHDRLYEAAKHGFKRAIVPRANVPKKKIEGIEIVPASRLSDALDAV